MGYISKIFKSGYLYLFNKDQKNKNYAQKHNILVLKYTHLFQNNEYILVGTYILYIFYLDVEPLGGPP